ncbi:hypothetical protein DY123_07520 [Apilactobacillus micheneri]|uniref:hypothetical protein n=1 Tax=Apilactobacillus micheneri TaxID=1899430 RepID=UPI001126A1F3|nr:hypothetical protein [Apilactobacillus micheneri]TPR41212.1 hypothetical protein DY123_07520 [Apilactobacillus micheneri]
MNNIKDKVKSYAKDNGLKIHDLTILLNISQSTLYSTYLYSNSDEKYQKITNAIDDYVTSK